MDISLNKTWNLFVDSEDKGQSEKWFSPSWVQKHLNDSETIEIPSNSNRIKGLDKYIGIMWFCTTLPDVPSHPKTHDYYIEFEGVNYKADVWMNGIFLGSHEGGFLPFRFNFNPSQLSLKGDNWLMVRVDAGLYRDGIPTNTLDWYNWTGIYRNVQVVIIEAARLRNIKVDTTFNSPHPKSAIIKIEYTLTDLQKYLDRCYFEQEEPQIEYAISYLGQFFGGQQQFNKVLIQTGVQYINNELFLPLNHISHEKKDLESFFSDIPSNEEIENNITDLESFFSVGDDNCELPETNYDDKQENLCENGIKPGPKSDSIKMIHNKIEIEIKNPSLWTPETPELYELELKLNGIDENKYVRFGIRQIETKGYQILLNHRPIKMKGVSLHEEMIPYGRRYPVEDRRREIISMKSLGFNALRSSHYSHDEILPKLADEEGLLLLEEIPLYWDCEFGNPKTIKLALEMIRTLIQRDYNHPSVILWSVGNEVPTERFDCQQTISLLLTYAKKIDPTRLITYVSSRMWGDTLRRKADVNCLNEYFGWYYGTPYQLNFVLDSTHYTNPNKPWIITEFGAGAKYGIRDLNEKFSEDNQARIIAHQIRVLNSKPYIAGWFIWIYRDFRSPLRLNQFQSGYNRKGIVDEFNHPKLIARVMPEIISEKITNIRHYNALARLFCYLALIPERIFYSLSSILYNLQRKNIAKYYSKNRE